MEIFNYNNMLGMKRKFLVLYLLRFFPLVFFSIICIPVFAQNHTKKIEVVGIVRDAHTKKPVPAAQVSVLNSKQTTSTDDKGLFKLVIPSNKALLHIGAYDYNVREIGAQGSDSLIIDMYSDVFTNYYKTVDGMTGLINNSTSVNSSVSTTQIDKTLAFNADQVLQSVNGDVRSINRSAQIGQGSSLFIRGLNSINANAQPLYVVDGNIWNSLYDVTSIHQGLSLNPLTNIDLDDIESISVMKDGTSLYGSKGANGVILIKTKRAIEMATKISLSVNSGVTEIPTSIPVMGANDFKTYATEMLGGVGYTPDQISKLAYLSDDTRRATYKVYHNNTNWADEVYREAMSQSYNINVKGGDEKALYYFSLGYTKNNDIVKNVDFQRYNMRYNGDIRMTKNINVAVNLGFARVDRDVYDDGVNAYTSPTWMAMIKSPMISPNNFSFAGDRTTDFSYTDAFNIGNPDGLFAFSTNTVKQTSFDFGLKPVIQINNNFSLKDNFDYNLVKFNEDSYRPMYFTAPLFVDGAGYTLNSRSSQVLRNNLISNNLHFVYKKNFENSYLNIIGGNRYLVNSFEADFVKGYNSGSNTSINLPGGFNNLKTTGINSLNKSISNYLNVDYNIDNRYIVTLVASLDASSRFGNKTKSGISLFNHDWGFFPGINGAWLISSEKFMKHLSAINLFKLRLGYGLTGNDDIKDYQTQTYFAGVRYSGVANGLVISNLANKGIQWETTSRANVGVDLSVFNDRLFMSVDLYSAKTQNLLVQKEYQDVAGLESYWTNDGKLSNKGIEASMNAKLLNFKNFHWELGVSVGHYINRIEELNNGSIINQVYDGEVITAVGGSVAQFYGYKTLGVFSTEKAAATAYNGNSYLTMVGSDGNTYKFGAGDIHFADISGPNGKPDGIINSYDKQVIGDPNPDVYGSIRNKFSYKNLTLSVLFSFSYGNQIYNYMRSQLESGTDFSNQSTVMLNRWTSENQITSQPKAVYGDPAGNSRFSDRWIEDGSYIRLKSLNLSYYLPIKLPFIESVNVSISANNLFTLTRYLGVDPESSSANGVIYQGIDAGLLPSTRNYNIGVKFNL
jgi:TonB-linked SusC/RagA family outer membrane protein